MMQILIAASTESEIQPFREEFPEADILVTGVGIAASVYHLLKRIRQVDYDLVVQAGVAGSFDQALQLSQVVHVVSDRFAEEGVRTRDGFQTIFEMGLASAQTAPYRNGWLDNPQALRHALPYPAVKAITVNMLNEDEEQIDLQRTLFNPSVESMEGASLHYVCLNEEVDFVQLRAISNLVGERNKDQWDLKGAIHNLNVALIAFYKSLYS